VGWNFLHSDKVSATLMGMLQERNFIHKLATEVRENLSGEKGWLAVPAGVDDLIVSVVADRIAEANGYDALTISHWLLP
jgi:hypothetical protein